LPGDVLSEREPVRAGRRCGEVFDGRPTVVGLAEHVREIRVVLEHRARFKTDVAERETRPSSLRSRELAEARQAVARRRVAIEGVVSDRVLAANEPSKR